MKITFTKKSITREHLICFLVILIAFFLSGCDYNQGTPVASQNPSGENFELVLLFQVDGVKVYRFMDFGRAHYFADCRGNISTTVPHGKTRIEESLPSVDVTDNH